VFGHGICFVLAICLFPVFYCLLDGSGQSRGIGFVRFDNVESATTAIARMHGSILKGNTEPIIVKVSYYI
jgi:hypothetical protein